MIFTFNLKPEGPGWWWRPDSARFERSGRDIYLCSGRADVLFTVTDADGHKLVSSERDGNDVVFSTMEGPIARFQIWPRWTGALWYDGVDYIVNRTTHMFRPTEYHVDKWLYFELSNMPKRSRLSVEEEDDKLLIAIALSYHLWFHYWTSG